MLALALSLLAPAVADCPASFQAVTQGSERAVVAYERANAADFEAAYADLRSDLDCLEAVLEPAEVRTLHLVRALAAWTQGDEQGTRAALGSVAAIDPEFDLRTEVSVYDAGLIAVAEEVMDAPPTTTGVVLPLVPWSTWRVDGKDAADADGKSPVGRPVMLQLIISNTGQMRSFYLEQGGLPEGFETPESAGVLAWNREASKAQEEQVSRTSTPREPREPRERSGGLHKKLGAGAGAAAVAAGAALAIASVTYYRFNDCVSRLESGQGCDEYSRSDLEQMYTINRPTYFVFVGMSGAAAVLSVGAVVTWRF